MILIELVVKLFIVVNGWLNKCAERLDIKLSNKFIYSQELLFFRLDLFLMGHGRLFLLLNVDLGIVMLKVTKQGVRDLNFKNVNGKKLKDLEEIKECYERLTAKKVPCPYCFGTGSATWKYPISGCPHCEGDGMIEENNVDAR
jgi:hypothetical protein